MIQRPCLSNVGGFYIRDEIVLCEIHHNGESGRGLVRWLVGVDTDSPGALRTRPVPANLRFSGNWNDIFQACVDGALTISPCCRIGAPPAALRRTDRPVPGRAQALIESAGPVTGPGEVVRHLRTGGEVRFVGSPPAESAWADGDRESAAGRPPPLGVDGGRRPDETARDAVRPCASAVAVLPATSPTNVAQR